MDERYKIIGIFKYNGKQILIIYHRKSHAIAFAWLNSNRKIYSLSLEEEKYAKNVLKGLMVDENDSEFLIVDTIGKNKYAIYRDKKTKNFFWKLIDGIEKEEDNYKLNFKYNYMPVIVYQNGDGEQQFTNKPIKFYTKLVRVGNKIVTVFVAATLSLQLLTGCSVLGHSSKENLPVEPELVVTEQVDESIRGRASRRYCRNRRRKSVKFL